MQTKQIIRQTVLSYLDDYLRRGSRIVFVGRRGLRTGHWSYARVARTAYKFARELEARGVGHGERVILCGANSAEWVAAFWGCLLRGVVVVPLDKESTPEFVAAVRQQTGAVLLLASSSAPIGEDLRIPVLQLEELSERIALHSAAAYPVEGIDENTLVEIIFTSGTTAMPKGVMLTHRNLLANLLPLETEIEKYIRWERLVRPVRFLNLVPLSHVFGQFMGIFVPQLLGGEVHFQESLNPSEIVRTTKKNRVSVVVLVPRLLDALREWVERDYEARGQLGKLREQIAAAKGANFLRQWWAFRHVHRRFGWKFWAFLSGGATLDEETETFWRRLGFAVIQGYGMTETAALISVNHPFKLNRGSIGQIMPGYEVKLDEQGEIMVRGASVSPGYWTGEESIASRSDEWLHTGDIGERDEAGNLYFKGRTKDVIVTAAGLNIYPQDLEAALNRQPEVRASCVISVEGAHGAEPLAVIILRDREANAEAAINRGNETLAEYQQIRRWFVWTAADFPRTATHKVLKREVAATVEEKLKGESEARRDEGRESSSSSRSLAALVGRIGGGEAETLKSLEPSANLTTDLKLDSLARVELLSALEDRYQISLDEAAFTRATTVGDIERMVQGGVVERVAATAYPYPQWTRSLPVRWLRMVLFYLIVMPITRGMSQMRAEGRARLEEVESPVLFVANHVTLADHALILVALPARLRHRLAIAMEGELLRDWRHPPEGTSYFTRVLGLAQYWLVNLFFRVFPLPKQSGFRRSFAYAGECADKGESVLVFPEGVRAPAGQMEISPFKTGAGVLAQELSIPVVPVKLEGLYELKRRKQYFATPGMVRVIFGEPVTFSAEMNPTEIAKDLERRVTAL